MILFDSKEAKKQDRKKNLVNDELLNHIEDSEIPVIDDTLDSADLMFFGRDRDKKLSLKIGMEIKTCPSDLLSSLSDGRLMNQLPKMIQEYDVSILVLVGQHIRVNFDTGKVKRKARGGMEDSAWSYHHLNSILTKFESAGGFIREVPDLEHLAAYIISTYNFWRKDDHNTETWPVRRKKPLLDWRQLNNPLAELYERIPQVGQIWALELAEYFPNVQNLMLMPVQALAMVSRESKGGRVVKLGKTKANRIWEFLHEDQLESDRAIEVEIV